MAQDPFTYDPTEYPPFAVTVDVVALTVRKGQLAVLLVERGEEPHRGQWALPGGFVKPDEDLATAAARELGEETGVDDLGGHLEQLQTYGSPDRDPRMRVVTVAYLAFAPASQLPHAGTDAAGARWWAGADVAPLDLAFDPPRILADGLERARAKLEYTPLAAAFVDEPFTAAELRRVYEAVWDVRLDPGNFWRKLSSTPNLLVPLGARAESGPDGGRPAQLFRRGTAAQLHPALLRPRHGANR